MSRIKVTNLRQDSATSDNISLDSSGNVAFQAGSASAPSLHFTGDTNTGIYAPAADSVAVVTGGSARTTVDSSGRLLVGTTSSETFNGDQTKLQIKATDASAGISIHRSQATNSPAFISLAMSRAGAVVNSSDPLGAIYFLGHDGTDINSMAASITTEVDGTPGSNDMPGRLRFATTKDGASSTTNRMEIAQEGQTRVFSDDDCFHAQTGRAAGGTYAVIYGRHSATGVRSGTACFAVYSNGNTVNTNNSYGSLSDIKLKENIVDAGSQWDDLKAIQVRKYNFKAETNQQTHTQLGVVAQEVELVSPGLVTESPDRDDEGNDLGTTTKSVNYSVLYMKSVKALQEAMTRIETLETANASQAATIAALDARLTALEG